MPKEKVLIIGAGAHAGVILDILSYDKNKEVIGFTDSNKDMKGKKIHGLPVLGDDSILENKEARKKFDSVIIGLGGDLAQVRKKIYEKIKMLGLKLTTAIHPRVTIAKSVKIGDGTAVMAGAIINPYTKIGENCVVNTGAVVDHDNVLEEGAFIQPGANLAGTVTVKKNAVVGIGATVLDRRTVGENSIVGAGAVVTKDVEKNKVVVGIPAKPTRDN